MGHRRRGLIAGMLIPLCMCLLAPAPAASDRDPDDLIRQGNGAFEAHDIVGADHLYALAEERTTDPGLVAFNRATVLFRRERYPEAEVMFGRVVQDAACPPERAARAMYNRGTCILHSGGPSRVYLDAIRYLAQCYDSDAADSQLKAMARNNLELAKRDWKKAYDQEKAAGQKPENPNDNPPPDLDNSGSSNHGASDERPEPTDPGAGTGSQTIPQPMTQLGGMNDANTAQTTTQGKTGSSSPESTQLPTAPDLQPRTPEATRKFLRDTAARLQRERQILDNSLYTSQLGIWDR
ncbi:MAG TPA: hypothetical protein VLM40_16820 [Gemmata sp.]|nr:hypothetical protein [Gemmata sp.]